LIGEEEAGQGDFVLHFLSEKEMSRDDQREGRGF